MSSSAASSSTTDTTSNISKAVDRSSRTRSAAREQIQQTWQQRRLETTTRTQHHQTKRPAVLVEQQQQEDEDRRPSDHPSKQEAPVLSVCCLIQKSWKQLWKDGIKKKNDARAENVVLASNGNSRNKKQPQQDYFPSVRSIFQRNALVRQVQSLQKQQQLDSVALLSVSNCDDWNQAVQQTAARRSRAFWVLDLARMVRRTVDWKQRYCCSHRGGSNSKRLLFVYNLHQAHADATLLKVLLQSGIVVLGTATKWDLERARLAVEQHQSSSNSNATTCRIRDSTLVTSKTDGYLREWLRLQHGTPSPLVVPSPEEIGRVCRSAERIWKRWQHHAGSESMMSSTCSSKSNGNSLSFILRLEAGASLETWQRAVRDTVTAIREERLSCWLAGISIDIGAATADHQLVQYEAIDALLDYLLEFEDVVAKQLRLDLTNVPTPTGSLSNGEAASFPEELVCWWNRILQQREDVEEITVDATQQLVQSAGALCTRIIGVREQQHTVKDTTQNETSINARRHLYIDDGCYGSLYFNNRGAEDSSHRPLPLFAREPNGDQQQQLIRTTIWGPTCDGLDQVCKDIPLPEMHRDEWLVFPNLSSSQSEGLGTAFNGFSPPDTCYCVVGYFAN